jgi:hypothetical protein
VAEEVGVAEGLHRLPKHYPPPSLKKKRKKKKKETKNSKKKTKKMQKQIPARGRAWALRLNWYCERETNEAEDQKVIGCKA